MNSRDRFFAVLRGEKPDRLPVIPISMMIAADTIGVPYKEYAIDYRVMARGQIAFAEKYYIDHVSSISDPATEAADCGAKVIYFADHPPALDESNSLLENKSALLKLKAPDPKYSERMSNRVMAVEQMKSQAGQEKIIEGWIEGPVAESADLRGINRVMIDFFDDPDFIRDLFEFVFHIAVRYAHAQVEAGADVIGVGDAAASLIGGPLFEQFALPYHKRIAEEIHEMGALVRL
ncbi:MAG: uroporphyrinogen decarboxylase, partial [Spirochaetales bacterium]|nr:uroporphyrinogen decarboxylase [Spirochaetales bacterium]